MIYIRKQCCKTKEQKEKDWMRKRKYIHKKKSKNCCKKKMCDAKHKKIYCNSIASSLGSALKTLFAVNSKRLKKVFLLTFPCMRSCFPATFLCTSRNISGLSFKRATSSISSTFLTASRKQTTRIFSVPSSNLGSKICTTVPTTVALSFSWRSFIAFFKAGAKPFILDGAATVPSVSPRGFKVQFAWFPICTSFPLKLFSRT